MDMQGSRQLAVTQQQAWEALNDPEVLKVCIPGCEKIEATGENQYAVTNAIKIGPVSARFNGKIKLTDIDAPNGYSLLFDGQAGAAGFGKGTAKVTLVPQGEGCELGYTVNAQVGGKIAQVGQRLIDGVAKSMAEDFFKRFDEEMQRRYPPPAVPEDSTASTSPADAQPASKAVPWWVWVAAAAVIAVGYMFMKDLG
ncbi:SRPBCC family protein [Ottowia caeni]|uniref:CoxG family protein n=1 Tax=Ottowia caeni TaxID=2870339 RepID=UPI001E4E9BB0|nr:carbon monoxide dehydrogenase subunit G [Ottowia caeni]